MIDVLLILYLTVFIAFTAGQRIAMTNVKTTHFLIISLLLWTFLKSTM